MMESSMGDEGLDMSASGAPLASMSLLGTTVSSTPPSFNSKLFGWSLIGLALVLAFIAFVLVLVLWFGGGQSGKKARKTAKCLCTLTSRVGGTNSNFAFYNWQTTAAGLTGTVALTALPLNGDGNTGITSPYCGTITAIALTASAIPTVGSITATLTKNGAATGLSTTLSAGALAPTAVSVGGSVTFLAGDQLGISYSTTTLTVALPVILTAQIYGHFETCPSSSSSSSSCC